LFFFLIRRRPASSTLFPYTTLFRSNEACGLIVGHAAENRAVRFEPTTNVAASSKIYTIDGLEQLKIERAAEAEGLAVIGVMHSRSEEHTSELQSRENLVCRLLLEKK